MYLNSYFLGVSYLLTLSIETYNFRIEYMGVHPFLGNIMGKQTSNLKSSPKIKSTSRVLPPKAKIGAELTRMLTSQKGGKDRTKK